MHVCTHAHANHSVHTINVFKSSRKAEKLPKLRTLKGSELIDEAQLIDLLASSPSASLPQPVSEALGGKTQGDKGSNQGNERLCWDKEAGENQHGSERGLLCKGPHLPFPTVLQEQTVSRSVCQGGWSPASLRCLLTQTGCVLSHPTPPWPSSSQNVRERFQRLPGRRDKTHTCICRCCGLAG